MKNPISEFSNIILGDRFLHQFSPVFDYGTNEIALGVNNEYKNEVKIEKYTHNSSA